MGVSLPLKYSANGKIRKKGAQDRGKIGLIPEKEWASPADRPGSSSERAFGCEIMRQRTSGFRDRMDSAKLDQCVVSATDEVRLSYRSAFPPEAVLTIATMPAFRALGRWGHALTTAARSG